jgi:hypothetical protein
MQGAFLPHIRRNPLEIPTSNRAASPRPLQPRAALALAVAQGEGSITLTF